MIAFDSVILASSVHQGWLRCDPMCHCLECIAMSETIIYFVYYDNLCPQMMLIPWWTMSQNLLADCEASLKYIWWWFF